MKHFIIFAFMISVFNFPTAALSAVEGQVDTPGGSVKVGSEEGSSEVKVKGPGVELNFKSGEPEKTEPSTTTKVVEKTTIVEKDSGCSCDMTSNTSPGMSLLGFLAFIGFGIFRKFFWQKTIT